jgi:hypothetical protein
MNDSEKGERLFAQLPKHEQDRIQALSPIAQIDAIRALGRSQAQTTQPTSTATPATPKVDVPPEKLAIAESFARTLPVRYRLELENLSGTKRLERTWEIKELYDRTGRLPGS